MSNTTTTQVTAGVNNFYDRAMLERAVPLFVHSMFAQVRDIPKNNTNVIKFRRYGNLVAATTALSEGVTPTGSQLSITDISATVAQYGDYVTLTDVLQMTTLDPVLTETAEILGDQAGDTLDQLARDIFNAGTTVQYASTANARTDITAAMKITPGEIREAVRTLKNANAKRITRMIDASTGYGTAPINSCYVGIIHPNATYDLKGVTGFTPVENYANKQSLMPGEVGAVDEVRLIESTNAKKWVNGGSGGAVDVYSCLIFGANAVGVTRISGEAMRNIIKALGSAGTSDPLDQRSTSGWKATFVAKILNETYMIRIEHGVTA